ncbi:MAG: hypothetical protein ACT6R7_16505 [Brevundimonas aurantiaca]|uniref:hypothetical protein n=1 Tax=Brevundimonas aurantiaca TaxID=74316 RepID=UPI0040338BE9
MFAVTLRDVTRRQRARVYVAALVEPCSELALDAAVTAARQLGLGRADALRLGEDAVRYGLACHGLVDTTAAQIATTYLNKGVITRPGAIIREARRAERRVEKATSHTLARRLFLADPQDLPAVWS